jgi:hypothetical protein
MTLRFHSSSLSPIITKMVKFQSPEDFYLLLGFNQQLTIYQFDLMALVIPEISQLDMTTLAYLDPDLMITIL